VHKEWIGTDWYGFDDDFFGGIDDRHGIIATIIDVDTRTEAEGLDWILAERYDRWISIIHDKCILWCIYFGYMELARKRIDRIEILPYYGTSIVSMSYVYLTHGTICEPEHGDIDIVGIVNKYPVLRCEKSGESCTNWSFVGDYTENIMRIDVYDGNMAVSECVEVFI